MISRNTFILFFKLSLNGVGIMKVSSGGARWLLLTGALGTAVFIAACGAQAHAQAASRQKYVLHVIAMKAHEADATMPLRVTGIVAAAESRDIAFRVGGTVVKRDVQTGDLVHAGQILARLGTAELQANITAAEADVASAKASLDLAQSDLKRQKSLLDKGFTTRSAFEQATKTVSVAEASLKIAESQLQIARDNLSYAELKAGADGIVTSTNVEVGQVVQAGQTVITLAAGDKKQAVFDVSEAILASASMAEPKIFLAADPSITTKAKIAEVSPTVNRLTGTVRIKADLIDPPARMSLGAAVTGEGTSKPVHGFILPYEALSRYGDKPAVWIINESNGTVQPRSIELLAFNGPNMVVRGELKDGDLVVTGGTSFLSPGLKVSFTEENQ
jgi:membrane fusion protein, multidrug efflux system